MADTADKVVKIKVIGVGGAGNNVINRMIASDVKGVEFVAVNTDKQDLEKSKCKNKVQIGRYGLHHRRYGRRHRHRRSAHHRAGRA